jgi:serine/threonine protein kinase
VVDVEGHETEVFEGFSLDHWMPQMIILELADFHPDLPSQEKVCSQLGIQMIERLQFLHENGLVHRDVKPSNFLLGPKGKEKILHLIDFGFCKRHMNGRHEHVNGSHKKRTAIIGTPNFISVAVHQLNEPDIRDDLESVGYMLIYFYLERLPWDGVGATLTDVMNAKMELLLKREMWEKIIPPAFLNFIKTVQTLDSGIDYDELINLLKPFI